MSRRNKGNKGTNATTNATTTNVVNNDATTNVVNNATNDDATIIASLLSSLNVANANKDRREGKRIRRALRAKGYYGGQRKRETHDVKQRERIALITTIRV